MVCSNCGRVNENENNYCKHCGTDLKSSSTDPSRTIFSTPAATNIDLGYLIISILILINVFMWIFWGLLLPLFTGGDLQGQVLYKIIRVISVMLVIAQFVVMFVFSKRPSYKIIIGIIAAVVIIYDLYFLVQTLTTNRY